MDWQAISAVVGLIVLLMQAVNLYVTLNIKLWVTENFVTQKECVREMDRMELKNAQRL
jgi:hypothetical protein